jgi:hypothetical protein
MEFIKKNYEKVLLGLVLLGLAVAVAFLPFKIASEREKLEEMRNRLTTVQVPPLPDLNMAPMDAAISRVSTPVQVNFGEPNKLFNPMPWQVDADGHLLPVTKVGPSIVAISNITALFTIISLDRVVPVPDSPPAFLIGVEKQAAASSRERSKRQYYCKAGETHDVFKLLMALGPTNEPSKWVIELTDTGEKGEITADKPFRRVDGYKAVLSYAPEKLVRTDVRVGTVLSFNYDTYTVVRISTNEVVLSASSNQKKWTISPTP